MTQRVLKPILILALLLAAVAGSLWWWRGNQPVARTEPVVATSPQSLVAAAGDAEVVQSAPISTASATLSDAVNNPVIANIQPASRFDPSAWPPLPAADKPLAEIWQTLKDRADRGDHQAACRLTLELRSCFGMDQRLGIVSDIVAERSQRNDAGAAMTLSHAESLLQQSERCAAIPEADRHDWRYIRQAARAGSITAMETYALEHWIPVMDPNVPPAEVKQILKERDYLLLAAAKSGSSAAQIALLSRFGRSYSGRALDPDAGLSPVEQAQIAEAMARLSSGKSGMEMSTQSPLTTAEREAVDEIVRHMQTVQKQTAMNAEDRNASSPEAACAKSFGPAPDLSRPIDWRAELGLKR